MAISGDLTNSVAPAICAENTRAVTAVDPKRTGMPGSAGMRRSDFQKEIHKRVGNQKLAGSDARLSLGLSVRKSGCPGFTRDGSRLTNSLGQLLFANRIAQQILATRDGLEVTRQGVLEIETNAAVRL